MNNTEIEFFEAEVQSLRANGYTIHVKNTTSAVLVKKEKINYLIAFALAAIEALFFVMLCRTSVNTTNLIILFGITCVVYYLVRKEHYLFIKLNSIGQLEKKKYKSVKPGELLNLFDLFQQDAFSNDY